MIKKLTILHSNDIHADFNGDHSKIKGAGGLPRLAEYIYQARRENPHTLYLFAGDMFNGDIMDKTYEGISTLECLNLLGPDAAVPGNHEVDYGLDHLLALNSFRKYPMICANLYMKTLNQYLFPRYKILVVGGLRILVIGVTTKEILSHKEFDFMMGRYCEYIDPDLAVKQVCESFPKTEKFDMTIILSHLGIDEDRKLAAALDPEWGVRMIIGGHTHTVMTEAEVVGDTNIQIVQLDKGSATVGRFDICYDTKTKQCDAKWQRVVLDAESYPENEDMRELIEHYAEETQEKYGKTITRLSRAAEHGDRMRATAAGNLLCDALLDRFTPKLDIVFLGSGSLRDERLDKKVSEASLINMYFYDEPFFHVKLTGAQLKGAVETFLRKSLGNGKHKEYYQLSKGCKFKYDKDFDNGTDENGEPKPAGRLTVAQFNGVDIQDDDEFDVGVERYLVNNLTTSFGLEEEEARLVRDSKEKLTTDVRKNLKNYFRVHEGKEIKVPEKAEKRTKVPGKDNKK